jgi:hypothetical protein
MNVRTMSVGIGVLALAAGLFAQGVRRDGQ